MEECLTDLDKGAQLTSLVETPQPVSPGEILHTANIDQYAEAETQASTQPKTSQGQYDLRQCRKLTEAMHSHLMEKWHTIHRRHERSWERLYKLYHEQKEELSPEWAHAVEGDKEDAYVQWMDSEQQLKDVQEQLRDPSVDSEMQSLQLLNQERKKFLESSQGSPQPEPHHRGSPVDRAESEVSCLSHAPSQRSHADPSQVSGKASSFRHMSRAHSSVSQQSHVTDASRLSKASSRRSRASRISQEEQIILDAKAAEAVFRVAQEVRQKKKELSAIELEEAKIVAKRKDAQNELELTQCQRIMADKMARAEGLQKILQYTTFLPDRQQLENEERRSRVQTYVDNQSTFQNAQMRAPQPATSPPRPSRRTEESQRPDSLVNCRVVVTTPRSRDPPAVVATSNLMGLPPMAMTAQRGGPQDLPTVITPQNPPNHTTNGNRMDPLIAPTALQQHQPSLREQIERVRATLESLESLLHQQEEAPQGTATTPDHRRQPRASALTAYQEASYTLSETQTFQHMSKQEPGLPQLNARAAEFRPSQQGPLHVTLQNTPSHHYAEGSYQPNMAHAPTPGSEVPSPPGYTPMRLYRSKLDLASKGVHKFPDKPGKDYVLWKLTFQTAIQDEAITSSETLGHMKTWLGPASTRLVENTQLAHLGNPATALHKAWERLDERYGGHELTEKSLLDCIYTFPNINIDDHTQMLEFADTLSMLHSVREQPNMPKLTCLDQFEKQRIIVRKLPKQSRDEWAKISESHRNQDPNAPPAFAVLAEFVTDQAKLRHNASNFEPTNDNFGPNQSSSQATDRTIPLVYKTDITPSPKKSPHEQTPRSALSNPHPPTKGLTCPIHKFSHSLNDCREFRKKSLDDRKTLLKENRICFKCCDSMDHIAKDCTADVKCHLCNSDRHPAALHLEPKTLPMESRQATSSTPD
ncbi:uncharacterized protein LOC120297805 [Crotalus tigris]|uniref:uncharacterized protein LOC120297805 n=1 Tax=Crotalus tigris TaxID=88082 RepID=UPI00192F3ACD|nr:uncharacterized protein LOC120297805 [Crotalus tigris]